MKGGNQGPQRLKQLLTSHLGEQLALEVARIVHAAQSLDQIIKETSPETHDMAHMLVDEAGTSQAVDFTSKEAGNKKRKKKDPNAPKRPTGPYLLFVKDRYAECSKENPELKSKEIVTKLGELWRQLSEEDKKHYVDEAAVLRERYHEEVEAYKHNSEDDQPKDTVVSTPSKKKASAAPAAASNKVAKRAGSKATAVLSQPPVEEPEEHYEVIEEEEEEGDEETADADEETEGDEEDDDEEEEGDDDDEEDEEEEEVPPPPPKKTVAKIAAPKQLSGTQAIAQSTPKPAASIMKAKPSPKPQSAALKPKLPAKLSSSHNIDQDAGQKRKRPKSGDEQIAPSAVVSPRTINTNGTPKKAVSSVAKPSPSANAAASNADKHRQKNKTLLTPSDSINKQEKRVKTK